MENITAEQLEALETMAEFNERLLKNLPTLITELSGNRQPDTDQYQKSIIDAINWEIAVINSTLEVLNQGKVRIHKEDFKFRNFLKGRFRNCRRAGNAYPLF